MEKCKIGLINQSIYLQIASVKTCSVPSVKTYAFEINKKIIYVPDGDYFRNFWQGYCFHRRLSVCLSVLLAE